VVIFKIFVLFEESFEVLVFIKYAHWNSASY